MSAGWICAVVACSAPEGEPHDPACPYAPTNHRPEESPDE